jgi:hypothetical protein
MNASNQISFDFSLPGPIPFVPSLTPASSKIEPNTNSREVIVNYLRLSDQGDISRSYSADLIDNGRIRKPFRYTGQLYICTSTITGFYPNSIRQAEAYRLTLATLFDRKTTDYQSKVGHDNGATARADLNGFYDGIAVTQQGHGYVLTGPPLTFLPNIPRT